MLTGIFIGLVTAAAIILPLWGAPKLIKAFIHRFPFLTDVITGIALYVATTTVTGSIAAIIGTAVAGLCLTAFIQAVRYVPALRQSFLQENP